MTMAPTSRTPELRRERGFTALEFVIANLAMLVVMGATFTLLFSTFSARASLQASLQTQQSVRVAINTIAREMTMAGTGLPGAITVPNGAGAVSLLRPGIGTTLPTPTDTLNIITPGEAEGPLITGQNATENTDVVTIVAVDQQSPTWSVTGYTDTFPGTDLNFGENVRAGATQLFQNNVLLFMNINGAVMGCVTSVSAVADVASFDDMDACGINQPGAAAGNFLTTMLNPDSTLPPTTATRINVVSYYLNAAGSHGHPSLMRAVNAQAPQELIEGVENLQITYDLYDFTTSAATANVVPAAGFSASNQIRSANIAVTGRSLDRLQRTGDYYRFGLTSKITIRNATFRNRYNGP